MVVLRGFDGLDIKIKVKGLTVADYPCDDHPDSDSQSHCVRYIESKPGQHFSIELNVPRKSPFPEYSIWADIYIDGALVDKRVFVRAKGGKIKEEVHGLTEFEDQGDIFCRKFMFQKIRTVTADTFDFFSQHTNLNKKNSRFDSLGETRIAFKRIDNIRDPNLVDLPALESILEMNDVIPEKALKGRAIGSKMRMDSRRKRKRKIDTTVGDDVDEQPFATYIFLYRTSSDLESLLVHSEPPPKKRQSEESKVDIVPALNDVQQLMALINAVAGRTHLPGLEQRTRIKSEVKAEDPASDLEEDGLEVTMARSKRICLPSERDELIDLT